MLIALLPFLLQYTLVLNYVDCALHLRLSNEQSLSAIYIMPLENSVYHISSNLFFNGHPRQTFHMYVHAFDYLLSLSIGVY